MMIWLWLFACPGADVLPSLSPPQAEMRVEAVESKVKSGSPVVIAVEAWAGVGWDVQAGVPFGEGLEVQLLAEEGPSVVDERSVQVWRYSLNGPDGSYVVGTTEGYATGPGDQTRTFEPEPIFVDIGVPGPTGGPMDGFVAPPPPSPPPYRWIAAALAGALLLLGAVWALMRWRAKRKAAPPPPVPAHIEAQGAWADARATISDDHQLALHLSMILRNYIEARTPIRASASTTVEISTFLRRRGFDGVAIDDDLRTHVDRILDATDRLKFAREGGGEAFFGGLDQHFEAVINQTRPRQNPPTERPDA
jgi:hypothetical protein